MPYVAARGHALLIPSGTAADPNRKHLFVVLTDGFPPNSHLLASLSTTKEGIYFDPSCIIEPGEHPFVTQRSYVEYRLAGIKLASNLTKGVDGWLYARREDVTPDLLQRICAGIEQSALIPRYVRQHYRDYLAHAAKGAERSTDL